jgi:hypothetical protein
LYLHGLKLVEFCTKIEPPNLQFWIPATLQSRLQSASETAKWTSHFDNYNSVEAGADANNLNPIIVDE